MVFFLSFKENSRNEMGPVILASSLWHQLIVRQAQGTADGDGGHHKAQASALYAL
jgi:hypothetical protein